jgi:hypothetical protein
MIATSLLYLQSKFELAGMNTCTYGSVVVSLDYVLLQRHTNAEEKFRTLCNQILCQAGKGATDTYEKIQKAFDNNSVSRAQVFQWHKNFVNGREMAEGEQRSGRDASVRRHKSVDRLRAFIRQDDVR